MPVPVLDGVFFAFQPIKWMWCGMASMIDAGISTDRQAGHNPLDEFFPQALGRKVACLVGMFRPEKDHGLALRVAQALTQASPMLARGVRRRVVTPYPGL